MMIDEEIFYRLDEILAENGGEESMVEATEVHGFLTAIECSQQEISPEQFNEVIWGQPQIEWLNSGEEKDYHTILNEMKAEIKSGLEKGEFLPVFAEFEGEDGEQMVDVEVWCESFCMAIGANEAAWSKLLEAEHQGLQVITLFGTEEGHEVLNITPEADLEGYAKAIAPATVDIYKAFRS